MQLNQLALKDEPEQAKGLKQLLKAGLKPDDVLMDLPAGKNRPAYKATTISLILAYNNIELLNILLEHGTTTIQLNTEIDSQIKIHKDWIAKLEGLKQILKPKPSSSS